MIIINKYATVAEANHKIRGGITGGVACNTPFEGLVGLTITFDQPNIAWTFTQPSGRNLGQLLFADVKAQLEANVTDLEVITINNMLAFRRKTAGQIVSLPAISNPDPTEPARTILGFSPDEAVAGQFLNGPSGSNPKYLEFVTECGAVYVSVEVT